MGWRKFYHKALGQALLLHRYSVDPTWLVPHFEKMLYDNAQLASLYIEASVVFRKPKYEEIARDTVDFIIHDMGGENGGFYSSYDADSDGVEGSFYIWSKDEIIKIAGPKDGPPLAMLLGISEQGNFEEGKSVVTRRIPEKVVAQRFNRSQEEISGLLNKWLPALRRYRSARVSPELDKKIITSWNGLAIAALSQAYIAFNEERYKIVAQKTADFLWNRHRSKDGRFYRSSYNGKPENEAIIDDYSFLGYGLLELYKATGNKIQLKRAIDLIDFVLKNFKNSKGAFYLTPKDHEVPLGRQVEIFDNVVPSGNSVLLQVLLQLATLTGNTKYSEEIEKVLKTYSGLLEKAGLEMALWYDVAQKQIGPYYGVIIVGDPHSQDYKSLLSTYRKIYPSHCVLIPIPATGPNPETETLLPTTKGKKAVSDRATAYVCQLGNCKRPTSDPQELKAQILEDWKI